MVEAERFYRAHEIAELMDVHVVTVRRWVQRGDLEAIRLPNGELRITPGQLDVFMSDCTVDTGEAEPDDEA